MNCIYTQIFRMPSSKSIVKYQFILMSIVVNIFLRGASAQCASEKCLLKCIDPYSDSCYQCSKANCVPALNACTGFSEALPEPTRKSCGVSSVQVSNQGIKPFVSN